MRGGLAGNENVHPGVQAHLAADPARSVRVGMAASRGASAQTLETLRADADDMARTIAEKNNAR